MELVKAEETLHTKFPTFALCHPPTDILDRTSRVTTLSNAADRASTDLQQPSHFYFIVPICFVSPSIFPYLPSS